MNERSMSLADGAPTTSVVLAGVGGQGILLATQVLARAAMASGFDVKTCEVHGMAQRGGAVTAQIRYGQKVYSPLVELGTADVLGTLECIESLRSAEYLRPGGLAVVSNQRVVPISANGASAYPEDAEARVRRAFPKLVLIDALDLAERAGHVKASNMVVLGALSNGLRLEARAWREAIQRSVKPKLVELNLRAFELGAAARA